jgi:hypothetical protein
MLTQLKLLLGITDTSKDTLLTLLLNIAADKALRVLFPFEENVDELVLPNKYNYWVVQAAQQMYQSLGSEQIQSYSENGLSISYRDIQSGISGGLLNELIPNAKALG